MGVSQISSTSGGPPDLEEHKEHLQGHSSNLELPKDAQNESKSIGPSCWLPSAPHAHSNANTPCSLLTAKAAQQLKEKKPSNPKPQSC